MNDEDICKEKWRAMCLFAAHPHDPSANPYDEWDIPTRPATKTAKRHRKPSLTKAKKLAAKAGLEVASYQIGADGTINVVPANPNETIDNPWDSVQ
jgi:hypothetical protein